MATTNKKVNLFDTEEGVAIKKALELMVADKAYNTESTYTADSVNYADNVLPFVDKHMKYLLSHPSLNPRQYLANLRLITRIR